MTYAVLEANIIENKRDILRIWERSLPPIGGSHCSNEDKLEWYYKNNPCGPGKCWLLGDQDSGQFVGATGLGPRRIKVLNDVVPVGLLADFAVDEEHRSFFPALMLQRKVHEALEAGLAFHYSTPVRASASVQLRLGHIKVGEMERFARILDARPHLQRMVRTPATAKGLAPLANAILRTCSRETWKSVDQEFIISQMSQFDTRFDTLWERAAPKFAVTGERTSEFLRWRYTFFPGRRYFTVGLLSRDEKRLFAYLVYYHEGDTISISDLFFEDPERPLANLLAGFLRFIRRDRAASVSFSFLGPSGIKGQLKRFGFYPRSDRTDVIVDLKANSNLSSVVLDPSRWYFVPGDREY